MPKQPREMTDEELFDALRGAMKGSSKYNTLFPEVEIRQTTAQIKSAKATSRSALWILITMIIIGVSNLAFILLQVQMAAGRG